jgi:outer membrane murein-binding lipoprotein Lpp
MPIWVGTVLAALLVAGGGAGGFLAFWNRKPDLASKMVAQAAAVVDTMEALNAQLRAALGDTQIALASAVAELKRSQEREDRLTTEVAALRADVAHLQSVIERGFTGHGAGTVD